MIIKNKCLDKKLYDEVNAALLNICNDIDEYDYYNLYKYILKKYNLYLFYDPREDKYYISEDWCLLI